MCTDKTRVEVKTDASCRPGEDRCVLLMAPGNAPAGPKKATNVSINRELLEAAKACGINLSATLEEALVERVRARHARQWLEDNRDAIAAYNGLVERRGVFPDGLRSF